MRYSRLISARYVVVFVSLIVLSLAGSAQASNSPAGEVNRSEATSVVTLHANRTGDPINPFIYGQFIEHLGRCIYGGIWAEMLEDRKFYFPITAEYRPYRGLTDTAFPVVGASPWEIIGSADAVTMVEEDSFVGAHTPRIKAGAGIRQRDLAVVEGKDYVGYIWLAAREARTFVNVALVWGEGDDGREVVRIGRVSRRYRRYLFVYDGRYGSNTQRAFNVNEGRRYRS